MQLQHSKQLNAADVINKCSGTLRHGHQKAGKYYVSYAAISPAANTAMCQVQAVKSKGKR